MIHQGIDAQIESFLRTSLEFFTHYYYAATAFIALIAVALIGVTLMSIRTKELKKELTMAIGIVNDTGDNEESFTANYSKVNGELSQLKHLGRHWEEFTETLIQPLEEIKDTQYRLWRNTKRPEAFFRASNTSQLIRPPVPGETLIGIGLLLTFLGLVAALTLAGPALVSEGEDIKGALGLLISTAGAKFLASIGGLLGSLITTTYQAIARRKIQRLLDEFCDALEKRLVFASAEKILADQFGHMKRQTENLEDLGNKIAVAIGDKIEGAMIKMPGMIGDAMQPVITSMNDLSNSVSQNNTDAIGQLVTQFKNDLTGASEASMNQVTTQLDHLGTVLASTVTSLQETTEILKASLTGSAEAAANKLQSGSEAFTHSLDAAMQGLVDGQASLQTTLATMVEKLSSSANDFDAKLAGQRDQLAQNMNAIVEKMNAAISSQTQSAAAQMGDKVNQLITTSGEKAAANMDKWATQLANRMEQPITGIRDSLEDWVEKTQAVTAALSQINQALDQHRRGIQDSSVLLQSSGHKMSESAKAVSDAAQPLRLAAQSASDAVKSLELITQNSSENLSGFSKSIESAISENKAMLGQMNDLWSAQAGQFKDIDKELESAFGQITNNLQVTMQKLQGFVTDTNDNLAKALDQMIGIVDALHETVDELIDKDG